MGPRFVAWLLKRAVYEALNLAQKTEYACECGRRPLRMNIGKDPSCIVGCYAFRWFSYLPTVQRIYYWHSDCCLKARPTSTLSLRRQRPLTMSPIESCSH